MKKHLLITLFFCCSFFGYSQGLPGRRTMDPNVKLKLSRDVKVVSGKSKTDITRYGLTAPDLGKKIVMDTELNAVSYIENPLFSKDVKNARRSTKDMSFGFLDAVKKDLRIKDPTNEFDVISEVNDNGVRRVKLQQKYKGVPVYGGELGLHSNKNGVLEFLVGKVFRTPEISVIPGLDKNNAVERAFSDLSKHAIVQKSGLVNKFLSLDPALGELMIFNHEGKEKLIYHLTVRPNLMERWVYFVDAHTGEVLDKYNHTCTVDGVVSASARDLNNVQKVFNAYQMGQQYVMIDTQKKMFNKNQSELPNSPVGAILTIDARNGKVDDEEKELYHVVTANPNQWNATAVSAHTNASASYDYFEKVHGRNSLNGTGGNILSVINITDEDGKGFDNAFWNGSFMGYGNGGQAFKPLAGSLDVAGHEMTHGVIENTAKLEYRNQSGALNESFADIFGAMIDRDNWTLGESVVNKSVFPSGALRSLQNPNQGGRNDQGYQPMNMSQYQVLRDTPEQDNGGVHINSGIPNHAYYLFATGTGMSKEKAEKVYYHALTRYLGRSSRFLDLRIAVIQSAKDLYGDGTETAAARSAFDRVGIVDGTSGTTTPNPSTESEVKENPGLAKMIAFGSSSNDQRMYMANFDFDRQMTFSELTGRFGCKSKPSVTDDGKHMVFIGNDDKIHVVNIETKQHSTFNDGLGVKWFNVAVSKDGNRLAAIANASTNNNYIFIINLEKSEYIKQELYNPTYSQGVSSGEVLYAEALEWDMTGEYVVYDAYNRIGGWFSKERHFYDVGVLRAWDPIGKTFGDGNIEKIFSSLPEGVNIGNPSFSKTNSAILAFDYIEEDNFGDNTYYILTVDLNKSSDGIKAFETNTIGFPDYSKTDQHLIFNYVHENRDVIMGVRMGADKITANVNASAILAQDASYGVSFASGTRELPKVLEQTIVLSPIEDKNPGARFDINATVSSNLPLLYTVESGNASVSGKTVSLGNTPGKVKVKVSQLGTSKFAATSKETDFCVIPPAPVLIDNGKLITAQGGQLYQFYFNGSKVGQPTSNANLSKTEGGVYSVRSVTADGCLSVSSNAITNTIILSNENTDKEIGISPNPVEEFFNVKVPENEVFLNLELYDTNGKAILKSLQPTVNAKSLSSGIFVMKVVTDKGKYSAKVVKI